MGDNLIWANMFDSRGKWIKTQVLVSLNCVPQSLPPNGKHPEMGSGASCMTYVISLKMCTIFVQSRGIPQLQSPSCVLVSAASLNYLAVAWASCLPLWTSETLVPSESTWNRKGTCPSCFPGLLWKTHVLPGSCTISNKWGMGSKDYLMCDGPGGRASADHLHQWHSRILTGWEPHSFHINNVTKAF